MIDREKLRKVENDLSEAAAMLDSMTDGEDGGAYEDLHEAYTDAYSALCKVGLVKQALISGDKTVQYVREQG